MNLKQLLNKFENEPILKRIVYRYRDQKRNIPGYKKALQELRSKRIHRTNFKIILSHYEEDGERWVRVNGLGKQAGNKKKEKYALDFTSWSQWLGMEITEKTLKEFKEIDILAHCFWEMTWHGFSNKEVRNVGRMMNRRVESIVKKNEKS